MNNNKYFKRVLYARNKTAFSLVLIFIMLALFGWQGILTRKTQPRPEASSAVTQPAPEILSIDLKNSYPTNPDMLIEVNNNLILTLYGETLTEENFEAVLDKQRMLFGEELLRLNPVDKHRENALKQIAAFKQSGIQIISVETEEPIFEPDNPEQCTVTVRQITDADITNTVEYILGTENGQWKILSWENI